MRDRGFRADRRRGQNFLFDPQLLDAFIDDAGLREPARVLEIGAGAGTLTEALLTRGHSLVVAEIEPVLCDYLIETLRPARIVSTDGDVATISVEAPSASSVGGPDWTLVQGDVLETKNQLSSAVVAELERNDSSFHLVANLPYAIATSVIQLLLERNAPEMRSIGVLVQREAAERWVAAPGSKEYGALTVLLDLMGEGRITRSVRRGLFIPPPKVDSAFFVWSRNPGVRFDARLKRVHDLARQLFSHRRKMVRAILKSEGLEPEFWRSVEVDPQARPEALASDAFVRLADGLSARNR
ncbi:MAG: 16S rRNA (adenine(1518)-N(6)/adenine(1519)-N(6))-dimethyltransferase RsmA [Planctomycetota bacterium]